MSDKIYHYLSDDVCSNWERILMTDFLMNEARSFKPSILLRRDSSKLMSDNPFILTEFFNCDKYDGRIITNTQILHGNKLIEIRSQWDTGATYSSISSSLVEKLNLSPIGKIETDTTSGRLVSNTYDIGIVFGDYIIPIKASESKAIENGKIDLLIGMDIIHYGDFSFSHDENAFCFSFRIPSSGIIYFK